MAVARTPRLSRDSIEHFLAALASADAPQNAVSASAVAAAMGASLLSMVASLPKTRSDSDEDRRVLRAAQSALDEVIRQLVVAMDTEAAVRLLAARRLPDSTATERSAREATLQLALQDAADVPLQIMRLVRGALTEAQAVASRGSRAASSDVENAVGLLHAGFSGARSNLEMRLTSLTNVLYTASVVDEVADLSEQTARLAREAEAMIHPPPA